MRIFPDESQRKKRRETYEKENSRSITDGGYDSSFGRVRRGGRLMVVPQRNLQQRLLQRKERQKQQEMRQRLLQQRQLETVKD